MCWLGPCPHDPLRCGLNSSTSYTDALRNSPQFANSLRGCTVLLCYCIARHSHVLPLESRCRLPSCGLGATVGWVGHQIFSPNKSFSRPLLTEGRSLRASGAQGPKSWVAPRGAGGFTGSGPACTVPRCAAETAVGAACQCWLGTWPHDPCLGDSAFVLARALSP